MKSAPQQTKQERTGLVTVHRPKSAATNHYKMLFSKVDRICRKDKKKIIAVTSSVKGEGKTTTVSNLAVAGAKYFGGRTLLIDGDFNNPSVPSEFNIPNAEGLVDVISGVCQLGRTIQKTDVENLAILQMGHIDHAQESQNIWSARQMEEALEELRGWFDYIWIDAPPILPLFDMNIISELADAILLVVGADKIPKSIMSQSLKSLNSQKIIGSVFNRSKVTWQQKQTNQYYHY